MPRRVLLACAAGATALYALFIARCSFVIEGTRSLTLFDDAMISMRYARNLVEHGQLTWNVGDAHVEGYTNLLWTLWMALVHLLPLSDLHISFVIAASGALLLLGAGWFTRRVAERVHGFALISVVATLGSYALVYWTLRGMEVGLLAFFAIAGTWLVIEGRQRLLIAVICAAVLTRTDAIVLALPWIGYAWLTNRRRDALVLAGAAVATLVAHTVFRYAYYGALMPNTYYLKLEGISLGTRLHRGFVATVHLLANGWVVPLALAVYGLLDARARSLKLLLAAQVALCGAYSIYVGGDAWEEFGFPNRYIAPALPALFVLAGAGICALRDQPRWALHFALALCLLPILQMGQVVDVGLIHAMLPTDGERTVRILVAIAFVILAVVRRPAPLAVYGLLLLVATTAEPWWRWYQRNAEHMQIDIGRVHHGLVLREVSPPTTTLATTPCGSIPYFARLPTIDLLGKSDPVIAHQPPRSPIFHPGHVKWDYVHSIRDLKPDIIDELFTPPNPELVKADFDALPSWGYVRVTRDIYVRSDARHIELRTLVRELR